MKGQPRIVSGTGVNRGAAMAVADLAAMGVAAPRLPELVGVLPRRQGDDAPTTTTAPAINPRTGKPYRGIPARAGRNRIPTRYADGPQPEGVRVMLARRREQIRREQIRRARQAQAARPAVVKPAE